MKQFSQQRGHLQTAIATAARAIIPVLLDAGRANSAKELQQLFFELDAVDQAMKDFVMADPSIALEGIIAMVERERR